MLVLTKVLVITKVFQKNPCYYIDDVVYMPLTHTEEEHIMTFVPLYKFNHLGTAISFRFLHCKSIFSTL